MGEWVNAITEENFRYNMIYLLNCNCVATRWQ